MDVDESIKAFTDICIANELAAEGLSILNATDEGVQHYQCKRSLRYSEHLKHTFTRMRQCWLLSRFTYYAEQTPPQ